MVSRPDYLPKAFAYNTSDKNVIPESPNPLLPGNASLELGFPPLTKTPLTAGGLPPLQQDFNGALNNIYQFMLWQQAGGQALWNSLIDEYQLNTIVFGSDGARYKCIQVNGSDTTAVDPVTDTGLYWEPLPGEGLTANRAIETNSNGVLISSDVTSTELQILEGAIAGTDKAMVFNASNQIEASVTTKTELSYLVGVTELLRKTIVNTYVSFVGATGSILENINVSSITRTATGQYTMNFINPLNSTNYTFIGSAEYGGGSSAEIVVNYLTKTVSSCTFVVRLVGFGFIDANTVNINIVGGIL